MIPRCVPSGPICTTWNQVAHLAPSRLSFGSQSHCTTYHRLHIWKREIVPPASANNTISLCHWLLITLQTELGKCRDDPQFYKHFFFKASTFLFKKNNKIKLWGRKLVLTQKLMLKSFAWKSQCVLIRCNAGHNGQVPHRIGVCIPYISSIFHFPRVSVSTTSECSSSVSGVTVYRHSLGRKGLISAHSPRLESVV